MASNSRCFGLTFYVLDILFYPTPSSSTSNIRVEPPGMPGCENLP